MLLEWVIDESAWAFVGGAGAPIIQKLMKRGKGLSLEVAETLEKLRFPTKVTRHFGR